MIEAMSLKQLELPPNLLNTAVNKLETLSELLDQEPHFEHTLFYCAHDQIDEVMQVMDWKREICPS